MREILLGFVQSGGLMAVLLLLFLIGFTLKIMAGLCYDNAIESMGGVNPEKRGIVMDIIAAYGMNMKDGKNIRNTQAFVENELHQWKKFRIRVERLEPAGDLFGGICLVICAFFDMLMLTQETFANKSSTDIMKYVYVYTTVSIIFYIILKIWSMVTYTTNKRMVLSHGLTNYIDNQLEEIPEYVTLHNMSQNSKTTKSVGVRVKIEENQLNQEGNKAEQEENQPETEGDIKHNIESEQKDNSLKKEDKERVITQVLDEFLV